MGRVIWFLALGSIVLGLQIWGSARMPSGEKRYEQYLRLVMERRGSPVTRIADF